MWNIAHRGGAGLWPENTLVAFENSALAGYAGAELDVQLTADGECIVFHDRDLVPARPITGFAYAELRQLKGGTQPEQIPTLHEVMACVRRVDPQFRLFIELKLYPTDDGRAAEALARAAVAAVRAAEFDARAVFVGFEWNALAHAKRLAPGIPVWFTTPLHHGTPRRVIDAAMSAGAQGWFAHLSDATPRHAAAARAEGLCFGVWTVNEDADLSRCIAIAADAVCTDFPDRLQRLRNRRRAVG